MAAMSDARELNLTLDFCLRVGELLLSSGAGAADVTASMQSLAWQLGVRHPDVDVTFTSLSMSFQPDPEEPAFVLIRQVKQRDIDYEDLTLVDHLVRDVLAGNVELKEARTRLARIVSSGHTTPRWAVTLGWGAMCAGVGLQLGGGPAVVAIAFVAAVVIDRLQLVMARRRLPFFYRQVAGGGVAMLIAVAVAAPELGLNTSLVVSANIIMLLAGIGFMGALQDALSGFYVTAGARLTEALLATAGVIAGVSGGLQLGDYLGVDVGDLDVGVAADITGVPITAIGAAICAASFAFASYAPRRSLIPIGLVAAVAMAVSQSGSVGGFGRTWPTAAAAFVVGLVSFTVAGRLRVPPLVVVVPAVVPMLPGLSIYRGLTPADPGRLPDLRGPARALHGGLDRLGARVRRDPGRVRRAAAQARGAPAREQAGRTATGRTDPDLAAHPQRGPQEALIVQTIWVPFGTSFFARLATTSW